MIRDNSFAREACRPLFMVIECLQNVHFIIGKNKETVVPESEMTGTAVFSFIGFGCQKFKSHLLTPESS